MASSASEPELGRPCDRFSIDFNFRARVAGLKEMWYLMVKFHEIFKVMG